MQICLTFPMSGLFNRTKTGTMRFSRWSIATALNMVFLFFTSVEAVLFVVDWIAGGGGINRGFNLWFLLVTLTFGLKLQSMGRRWSDIAQRWAAQEAVFCTQPYSKPKKDIAARLTWTTIFSLIVGIQCQLSFVGMRYDQARINKEVCKLPNDYSIFVHMYVWERAHLFRFVRFRWWMSPVLEWQYLLITLFWMLGHNFVMICSVWLTVRLRQLKERIEREINVRMRLNWEEIYDHFHRLVDLIEDVNGELGFFVLLVCLMRLIFVCYYIFKIIRCVWAFSTSVYSQIFR